MNSGKKRRISGDAGSGSTLTHRQHLIRAYWIRKGCSVEFKDLGVESIWDEDEQANVDVKVFRISKIWDRKTNATVYADLC